MRRNVLLLILVLVVSLVVAPYLGAWYNRFSPQYGSWTVNEDDAIFFAGMVISYIVLVPFILELFGSGNKNKWIIWSLVPVVLFLFFADIYHVYISIILGVVAFLLAKLINFIISKFKRPNTQIN